MKPPFPSTELRVTFALCTELDGTLIRSNTAIESFFGLLRKSPLTILTVLLSLLRGSARFKRSLAQSVSLDPALLPYRTDVVEWLRAEARMGRRIVLATASDSIVAHTIANHLGFFSEVIGSDGKHNLKGTYKAQALRERFGNDFVFVSDSASDLPVWAASSGAVAVELSTSTLQQLSASTAVERTFSGERWNAHDVFQLVRIHQWVKNLLLFVPLITSHRVLELPLLGLAAGVFLALGPWASSTYILNDLMDLAADRAHPVKRYRPLASGRIPVGAGITIMLLLAGAGLAIAYLVSPAAPPMLAAYLCMTFLYSTFFKSKLLADVFVLAALYCFRILAGGWITGIPISIWLLAFSYLLFLSLAFCKRSSELTNMLQAARASSSSARAYDVSDLEIIRMLGVATALGAVLEFCLYLTSDMVRTLYSGHELLWLLVPIALYWVSRVWMIAGRGEMNEDPLLFALKDRATHVLMVIATLILLVASQSTGKLRLLLPAS